MAKVTNKLKCRICDKKIIQYHMKEHVKEVHDGIKDHQCEICNKKFSRLFYMKEHVKTVHDGIKDYQCKICKKKFGYLVVMKRHIEAVHDGIKDHQCKICKKKFGLRDAMKIHVKTVHDGIKDHQCKICNKKFGQLSHMMRHVKEVHDGMSRIRSLKCKKQVETTQKGSKNAKDSKRMKILEKEALDVSNIAGFDHENPIVGKVPTIKNEVKIEPLHENINKGLKNVKVEAVEENFDKLKIKIITKISLFDANVEENYMILTKMSELIQKMEKN